MKFIKQTQYSAVGEIDWSNPITQSLQFCYNADIGDIDLVRRIVPTSNRTAVNRNPSSKYGYTNTKGVVFSGHSTNHLDITSGGLSIFICGYNSSLNVGDRFITRANDPSSGSNQGWEILSSSVSTTLRFGLYRNNVEATNSLEVLNAVSVGPFNYLCTTNGTSSKKLYSKGQLLGSSTTGNFIPLSNTTTTMGIASVLSTGPNINLTMIWTRELAAAEASALYENPHQIFRSKVKYLGIPTYNITSYSGTVATTLSSPTLSTSVVSQSTPTGTVNASISDATGNIQSFFNQTDNVILLNQSYPVTNGNSYAQISDGTSTPSLYGTYYVGKSGTIGYGFASTVDYDTVVFVEKQIKMDQTLVYDKDDIYPIVNIGGTVTF